MPFKVKCGAVEKLTEDSFINAMMMVCEVTLVHAIKLIEALKLTSTYITIKLIQALNLTPTYRGQKSLKTQY